MLLNFLVLYRGHGRLNELGSWIT